MIINNASRLPTKKVTQLAEFVLKQFPKKLSKRCFLFIQDGSPFQIGASQMQGVCQPLTREEAKQLKLPGTVRYLLVLTIHNCLYPCKIVYRRSVDTPTLDNWSEEFVHVLSHETRHAERFEFELDVAQPEVDSELKGNEVYLEYLKDKSLQRGARKQVRDLRHKDIELE